MTAMPKMSWNCENGTRCFNREKRPKIEVFDECFPGLIAFSDVDGIVEINARGLMLEWKSGRHIPVGQELMYKHLSAHNWIDVLVVCGNAETMEVRSVCVFRGGRGTDWMPSSLWDVKRRVRTWAQTAQVAADTSRAYAKWMASINLDATRCSDGG
jgi:hypothetical protein